MFIYATRKTFGWVEAVLIVVGTPVVRRYMCDSPNFSLSLRLTVCDLVQTLCGGHATILLYQYEGKISN